MRAAEKDKAVLMSYRLVESEAKKSAHSKLIDKIVYGPISHTGSVYGFNTVALDFYFSNE